MAVSGTTSRAETLRDERPEEMDMIRWYEDGVAQLVSAVSTLPADQPCWTWAGPQNIAWLTRRMAHETTVHAWDVAWAAGLRPEISAELASDGIDEFLFVMTPLVREGQPIVGGSVHLHCTDIE
ncbi:MAG: maleylpyruvate isomerase family mycothiol-dependent enzyme, partial [Acidimicrobiaceae bacterium]